jgi:branched-chain amino acid aminotransferase
MPDLPQMIYVSGRMAPEREATVSALDAGLLLGAGLFETLRTYGGKAFRLDRHLARLRASGEIFRVFLKESDAEIAAVIAQLVEANGVPDARVRITATRGPLTEEMADDEAPRATLIITAGPMTPYAAELYERGCTVVVSDIRVNETDPVAFHKTTNYMRNLLALRDAHRARATEALCFNSKNRLAEGSISNVFLVSGGRLLTPPVEEGLLAGITRQTVLELAADEEVPAEQRPLGINDLLAAEEVFLTNSIMEVLPVGRIEQHEVGDGKPGPITRTLAGAYKALVARETKVTSD